MTNWYILMEKDRFCITQNPLSFDLNAGKAWDLASIIGPFHYFPDAVWELCEKLTRDDVWLFGAEEGVAAEKIYYRR